MKKLLIFFALISINSFAKSQTVLMQEDFTNDQLPVGWYQDSAGNVPVNGWQFNVTPNPGIIGAGFDDHFLTIDGYVLLDIDASIITSSIDASMLTTVYLSYGEFYNGSSFTGIPEVAVSNDNGNTWHVVTKLTNIHGGISGPNGIAITNIVDITQVAAGYSNVIIKFRFICNKSSGPFWLIDHVRVSDFEPCNTPPDSGYTTTDNSFACTGSPINLWLENLSRGAGQTYQWQKKNASTGNIFTDITGATYDTLNNFIHNDSTTYQCLISCSTQTENSIPLVLNDVPDLSHTIEANGWYGSICPGSYDSLRSFADNTIPGTGYQWTWSPVYNGTYTDIAGATNSYYLLSDTNTLQWFYKCKQVCTSNDKSNLSSNYIQSYFNPNPYCYCIPVNFNVCNDPQFFNGSINNVTIQGTGLNNNSGCNQALNNGNVYSWFPPGTNTTATLVRGTVYPFSVTIDSLSTPSSIDIWIDYDRNGNFDSYENTEIAYGAASGSTTTNNVSIPMWASIGLTGMRVRIQQYFFLADSTDGCTGMNGGETEDYMVTIDSTVGIWDLGWEISDLRLSPNPTKGEVTISSYYPVQNLSILNTNAAIVFEKKNINNLNEKINTVQLTNGVYMVKAETSKGTIIKKLVVMKE